MRWGREAMARASPARGSDCLDRLSSIGSDHGVEVVADARCGHPDMARDSRVMIAPYRARFHLVAHDRPPQVRLRMVGALRAHHGDPSRIAWRRVSRYRQAITRESIERPPWG